MNEPHRSPTNLLALVSAVLGGLLFASWCALPVGVVLAPLGLLVAWLGVATGVLGLRHARQHGFGRGYAVWGILLGGVHVVVFSGTSLLVFGSLGLSMMEGVR